MISMRKAVADVDEVAKLGGGVKARMKTATLGADRVEDELSAAALMMY